MKYRIVGFDVPPGSIVEVPDGVIPLNTLYLPTTGLLTLACIQPIEEEPAPEKVEPAKKVSLDEKVEETPPGV